MTSRSVHLLDLPPNVISDVLWQLYRSMRLDDWLRLMTVCSVFAKEIDRLIVVREPFAECPRRATRRKGFPIQIRFPPRIAAEMTVAYYARYLSQKILRIPPASGSCFSRTTHHVATTLVQHQQQLCGHYLSRVDHQQQYNGIVYQLCKARATVNSSQPLADMWVFDSPHDKCDIPTSATLEHAVAAGAAFMGIHSLLFDPSLPREPQQSHIDVSRETWHGEVSSAACRDCAQIVERLSDQVHHALPESEHNHVPITRGTWYGEVLSAACRGGYAQIVERLLDQGHRARGEYREEAAREGHLEIVKILSRPEISSSFSGTKHSYFSGHFVTDPLEDTILAAVKGGHQDIVSFLLPVHKKASNFFRETFHGDFLTAAALIGHTSFVRQGLAMGFDVEQEDRHHRKPLVVACRAGYPEVVASLLDSGAKSDGPYVDKMPMGNAGARGHVCVMRQLLDAGFDVNSCEGRNLLEPCYHGRSEAVKFLFDNGYNISKPISESAHLSRWLPRAVKYVSSTGCSTILDILTEHGVSVDKMLELVKLERERFR